MLILILFLSKEKVSPEQLDLLVKTEWQLSYVTPLYQFRHTQLKSYSRQLSAFIAAERQQGVAVEVEGPQSSFRVSFSVVQGMRETDDDAETVLIQVIIGLCRGREELFSLLVSLLSVGDMVVKVVCVCGYCGAKLISFKCSHTHTQTSFNLLIILTINQPFGL